MTTTTKTLSNPSNGSFSNLLQLMKNGDTEALNMIWERFGQSIAKYAHRKLPPTMQQRFSVEDACSSVYGSLCRMLDQGHFREVRQTGERVKGQVVLSGWGALFAYLAQMAHWKCQKHRRKDARLPDVVDEAMVPIEVLVEDDVTEAEMMKAIEETSEEVLDKVRAKDWQRQAFHLYLQTSLSKKEIADIVDRSEYTVQKALRKIERELIESM